MKKLTVYEKKDYSALKNQFENEGLNIISYSQLLLPSYIYLLNSEEITNYVIDISNIDFETLKIQGQFTTFESSIISIQDNVQFVIDTLNDEIKFLLKYCFNSFDHYINLNESEMETINIQNTNKDHVKRIIDLTDEEFEKFTNNFSSLIIGHEGFKNSFINKLKEFRIFNKIDEDKIFSLFVMGNSGIGKTQVAKSIFKSLGGETNFIKLNFGNYSNESSLNSLIGSPRGYIGSDTGELFEKINSSNIGVILIDEFEKSNSYLFNYFLDLLESGTTTNSLGKEYNLNGYIIVFTSNIPIEDFENTFPPELVSRFNLITNFYELSNSEKRFYCNKRIQSILSKLHTYYPNFKVNDILSEDILNQIDVSEYDNMRYLNRKIKELISNAIYAQRSVNNVSNESVNLFLEEN